MAHAFTVFYFGKHTQMLHMIFAKLFFQLGTICHKRLHQRRYPIILCQTDLFPVLAGQYRARNLPARDFQALSAMQNAAPQHACQNPGTDSIYNQLYLDYLDAAFKGGCIKDGKIAQQCSGGGDSAMSTLDYLDLLGEMNLAENAASALVLNLVDDLEEQCWTIHGELSNTVSVLLSYPKGAA